MSRKTRTEELERRTGLRRAEFSEGPEIRRGQGTVGEELVRRGVVYALVCEEDDDTVVRECKWRSGQEKRRCENDRAELWLTRIAREHACGRK